MNETDLSLVSNDELVEELAKRFDDCIVIGVSDHTEDTLARYVMFRASNYLTLLGAIRMAESRLVDKATAGGYWEEG